MLPANAGEAPGPSNLVLSRSPIRQREALLFWPGFPQLAFALRWAALVAVVFGVVFGGTNWLAAQHSRRVRLHFDFELATPFVAPLVVAYLSLNLLLALAPFVLRTRAEVRAIAWTLIAMTLAAAPVFLLLPANRVHDSPANLGRWHDAVTFARTVALEHNFAPSLHVAFAVVCASAYSRRAFPMAWIVLGGWTLALAASTLLLHQHFLIDVVAGYAFARVAMRYVYDRLAEPLAP